MSNLYKEVLTSHLSTSAVDILGIPPIEPEIESLLPQPFVVLSSSEGENLVKSWRITPKHGRSVEVDINGDYFVHDGRLFGSVTVKGNDMTNVYPSLNTRIDRFQINGLIALQHEEMQRMIDGSSVLLAGGMKAGVETESPLRVTKPDTFLYKGEWMAEADFRKAMLDDAKLKTNPLKMAGGTDHLLAITADKLDRFEEWLDALDFYILDRAQTTPERLADLRALDDREDFLRMMERAFRFIVVEDAIKHDLTQSPGQKIVYDSRDEHRVLNVDLSQQTIDHYFSTTLPGRIGVNMGRMHKKGVTHHCPHTQNILSTGGIVDNDSLRGMPLSDPPMTEIGLDYSSYYDLKYLFQSIRTTSTNRLPNLIKVIQEKAFVSSDPLLNTTFQANLLRMYCVERWGENALEEKLPITLLYALASNVPALEPVYNSLNVHGIDPDTTLIGH